MNLFKISLKQLFQKNRYGFITFSVYASIFAISLGVCLLIIVDSFSSGFHNLIDDKLAKIDGHIRITKFNKSNDLSFLDSLFDNSNSNVNKFISSYAIIGSNKYLDNSLLYGVESNLLDEAFNLNSFVYSGKINLTNNSDIIIGYKLADILNLGLNDQVQLYNIDQIQRNNLFIPKIFNVKGIIKTGFPEYDKVLAFIQYDVLHSSFNTISSSEGSIINFNNTFNLDYEMKRINEMINPFHFSVQSWQDRHKLLYDWLEVYNFPIYFVMIFIVILGSLNTIVPIRLIINKKKINFAILSILGFSKYDLFKIIIIQFLIISLLGTILGMSVAFLFLFLQNKFRFIALSSDVYFIDFLPAILNIENIFLIFIFIILFAFLLSYVNLKKINKISPSMILRSE